MSERFTTFVDACLSGDADVTAVDDWVDRWHAGEGQSLSLDEFLGFTDAEGKLWAERPDRLASIINARRTFHLIYTDYGPAYGWSIQSPQVPGLTGGRSNLEELLRDTNDILEFAESPIRDMHAPGVYLHEQHAVTDPSGNDYLIRFLTSIDGTDDDEARIAAASRLQGAALDGWTAEEMQKQPRLPTSERLLIAVTASDTIGWIIDQLGDASASLSRYSGDDVLWTVPFGVKSLGDQALFTLRSLGLGRDNSFGELADAVVAAEAYGLVSKHKVPAGDLSSMKQRLTGV